MFALVRGTMSYAFNVGESIARRSPALLKSWVALLLRTSLILQKETILKVNRILKSWSTYQ